MNVYCVKCLPKPLETYFNLSNILFYWVIVTYSMCICKLPENWKVDNHAEVWIYKTSRCICILYRVLKNFVFNMILSQSRFMLELWYWLFWDSCIVFTLGYFYCSHFVQVLLCFPFLDRFFFIFKSDCSSLYQLHSGMVFILFIFAQKWHHWSLEDL